MSYLCPIYVLFMFYLCSIYVHLCLQKGDDCDNPHFGTPWCPVILVNSVPRIGIFLSHCHGGQLSAVSLKAALPVRIDFVGEGRNRNKGSTGKAVWWVRMIYIIF